MTKKQLEAKRILEEAMREARWREQRQRYQGESGEAPPSRRRSITATPDGLSEARRQELRRTYGLALPDDIPVAPDPTSRPVILSLHETAKGVPLPDGIHRRFAEACGAPPLVELPEGLHERLAAAFGRRGQRRGTHENQGDASRATCAERYRQRNTPWHASAGNDHERHRLGPTTC